MSENALTKRIPTVQRTGIQAKLAAAERAKAEQPSLDPLQCANRIGLIFDDSASMAGKPVEDARVACEEFLKSCGADTAVALYPLNQPPWKLVTEMHLLVFQLLTLQATGSTPTYRTLREMLAEPITRAVVFSDGDADETVRWATYGDNVSGATYMQQVVALYKAGNIPVDTVFIGKDGSEGCKNLQWLAKETDGIFMRFESTAQLRSGLKYLAPATRALLANPEIKAKVERGEKI